MLKLGLSDQIIKRETNISAKTFAEIKKILKEER